MVKKELSIKDRFMAKIDTAVSISLSGGERILLDRGGGTIFEVHARLDDAWRWQYTHLPDGSITLVRPSDYIHERENGKLVLRTRARNLPHISQDENTLTDGLVTKDPHS